MVDVRDLVAFDLKLLEERRGGTYNAAGPREALTMEGFLDQAIKALGSTSRLVWIDDYEFPAPLRISVGAACYPTDAVDADSLKRQAVSHPVVAWRGGPPDARKPETRH